jgi:Raf kinase inhibitor-like YbhB/YbcL family protein
MQLRSDTFEPMQPIPDDCALFRPGAGGEHYTPGGNRNPHLAWREIPAATRSFVLVCVDPDAPADPTDVNQQGRRIARDAERTEFVHWVLIDIPRECAELGLGSCSDGIVPRGKREPPGPPGSRQGPNDYTAFFAGDADMGGTWLGYDGPCPPWNDERPHRYHFRVYALDIAHLEVDDGFELADVRTAIAGHVLAEAELIGTYTTNPALRG